jgi:aldehyde dehydrogenase (NAD+)
VRPDKGGGFLVEPTCFVDVRNDMRIAQEEIFGPALVVIPYETDDDAIRIANESAYGLASYVTSGSSDRAMRMAREWGLEGIEEFLDSKVIASRV